MGKNNKTIDVNSLKITSGLSLIGILIGFGVTIGINVSSFNNMKNQLSDLSQSIDNLESKIYDKFDKQTSDFNKEITKVQNRNARMEGKMEVYLESLK